MRPELCKHTGINVESNKKIGFNATCISCGTDVSEDAQRPGRSYKYVEKLGCWIREHGGYGVRTI
jgi:hypothetical protein